MIKIIFIFSGGGRDYLSKIRQYFQADFLNKCHTRICLRSKSKNRIKSLRSFITKFKPENHFYSLSSCIVKLDILHSCKYVEFYLMILTIIRIMVFALCIIDLFGVSKKCYLRNFLACWKSLLKE